MEHQEDDQLLLARAGRTCGRTSGLEHAEATEQLDPWNGLNSHGSQDYMNRPGVELTQLGLLPGRCGEGHEKAGRGCAG